MLAAFETARSKGVRGGRVHDYLHAVAAIISNAVEIVTVDENDFDGLSQIKVSQLP
jgi:hypothetical protein